MCTITSVKSACERADRGGPAGIKMADIAPYGCTPATPRTLHPIPSRSETLKFSTTTLGVLRFYGGEVFGGCRGFESRAVLLPTLQHSERP